MRVGVLAVLLAAVLFDCVRAGTACTSQFDENLTLGPLYGLKFNATVELKTVYFSPCSSAPGPWCSGALFWSSDGTLCLGNSQYASWLRSSLVNGYPSWVYNSAGNNYQNPSVSLIMTLICGHQDPPEFQYLGKSNSIYYFSLTGHDLCFPTYGPPDPGSSGDSSGLASSTSAQGDDVLSEIQALFADDKRLMWYELSFAWTSFGCGVLAFLCGALFAVSACVICAFFTFFRRSSGRSRRGAHYSTAQDNDL